VFSLSKRPIDLLILSIVPALIISSDYRGETYMLQGLYLYFLLDSPLIVILAVLDLVSCPSSLSWHSSNFLLLLLRVPTH
jgi:hypothetical protein